MITVELVNLHLKGSPYTGPVKTRAAAEAMIGYKVEHRGEAEADKWELLPIPSCPCCGDPAWENGRCTKHQGRTACVVEGCKRTTARSTTYFICGQHWKAYVPPKSPERRTLNRLVRLAKKAGYTRTERWPYKLECRWWRLWNGIARRVAARSTAGHLDQAAIEKMFGWDDGEG